MKPRAVKSVLTTFVAEDEVTIISPPYDIRTMKKNDKYRVILKRDFDMPKKIKQLIVMATDDPIAERAGDQVNLGYFRFIPVIMYDCEKLDYEDVTVVEGDNLQSRFMSPMR